MDQFIRACFDAAKQGNLGLFNLLMQNPRIADMRDENDDTLMHVAGKIKKLVGFT
jgi:hypothetical protein